MKNFYRLYTKTCPKQRKKLPHHRDAGAMWCTDLLTSKTFLLFYLLTFPASSSCCQQLVGNVVAEHGAGFLLGRGVVFFLLRRSVCFCQHGFVLGDDARLVDGVADGLHLHDGVVLHLDDLSHRLRRLLWYVGMKCIACKEADEACGNRPYPSSP